MTAADYRHAMKIAIFALDAIFDKWNGITCREICELYAKFNKMYIMSRQVTYTENDLKKFEVIIRNKLKIKF
jgi:L-arabinose isomerase